MNDSFIRSVDQLYNINRVKDDPFHRQKKRNGQGMGFAEVLEEQKAQAAETKAAPQPKVDTFATLADSSQADNIALAYYRARMAKR